jgi:hypothetical protein
MVWTGATMDLGNLHEYWRMVAQEFKALEALPSLHEGRILSARAFDESQVAGPRAYMGAERYLNVARDNHEALLALLEHHGATLWAPWSLLRPTFETSFLAAWILDPEDGRERRARGLRCEILDYNEQRNHRAAFKVLPEVRKLIEENERESEHGSLKTYKQEAAKLGWSFDKLRRKINTTDELRKLSFAREQREFTAFLEATWRLLSGFEHGLGWALLSGADRTIQAHIPGGVNLELVINDEQFVNAAKTTYFLLLSACRVFKRRHLEPSQPMRSTHQPRGSVPRTGARSRTAAKPTTNAAR